MRIAGCSLARGALSTRFAFRLSFTWTPYCSSNFYRFNTASEQKTGSFSNQKIFFGSSAYGRIITAAVSFVFVLNLYAPYFLFIWHGYICWATGAYYKRGEPWRTGWLNKLPSVCCFSANPFVVILTNAVFVWRPWNLVSPWGEACSNVAPAPWYSFQGRNTRT